MRFRLGPPPETPEFRPLEHGWKPLKEPSPKRLLLLYSMPLFCLLALMFWLAWRPLVAKLHVLPYSPLDVLLVFAVLLPIHELVHMLAHPDFGRQRATVIGVWPRMGAAYAHYTGELTRERFLVILVAPLLVISIVPLAVAHAVGEGSYPIALASILNAGTACADVVGIVLIVAQLRHGTLVRNQGYKTYWR